MVFPRDSCEHLSLRSFLKESSVGIFKQESQIGDSLHAKPLHDVLLNVPFYWLIHLKISVDVVQYTRIEYHRLYQGEGH